MTRLRYGHPKGVSSLAFFGLERAEFWMIGMKCADKPRPRTQKGNEEKTCMKSKSGNTHYSEAH